jgi:hypothetical protein
MTELEGNNNDGRVKKAAQLRAAIVISTIETRRAL